MCTLEPACQSGFNEYPQCMFWIKNKKIRYSFSVIMQINRQNNEAVLHYIMT